MVKEGTADDLPSIVLFLSQSEGDIVNLNEWMLSQQEAFDERLKQTHIPFYQIAPLNDVLHFTKERQL